METIKGNDEKGETIPFQEIEILRGNIKKFMPIREGFTYTRGLQPPLTRKELNDIAEGEKTPPGIPKERSDLLRTIGAIMLVVSAASSWAILGYSTPHGRTMKESMRIEKLIKESEDNAIEQRPGSEPKPTPENRPQIKYWYKDRLSPSPYSRPPEPQRYWLKRPKNF